MFEARTADGTSIDIDQFRLLEGAEDIALFCTGCNAEVLAVAWKPSVKYKRSSHFRLSPGHKHEVGCLTEAYEEFVDSGKQRPIQSASDFAGRYPSRLVFRKQEALVKAAADLATASKDRYIHASTVSSQSSGSTRSGNTTSSLLQACHFYVSRPAGRHWPFRVDGIDGASYEEVFKSLHRFPREQVLSKRIYFSSLPFTVSLDASPESILLPLLHKVTGVNERHYRLRVCWKDWSEIRRDRFLELIKEKRAYLKERWLQEKRSSSARRSCVYVFFIGEQAEDDRAVFSLSDPRYVCILPWSYEATESVTR